MSLALDIENQNEEDDQFLEEDHIDFNDNKDNNNENNDKKCCKK